MRSSHATLRSVSKQGECTLYLDSFTVARRQCLLYSGARRRGLGSVASGEIPYVGVSTAQGIECRFGL